jgi:hypothetical protein
MGGGVARVYKRACDRVKTFSPTYHMTRTCSKLASFSCKYLQGHHLRTKELHKIENLLLSPPSTRLLEP